MRLAHDVPGGALVRHLDRVWLKASRDSKDYVNHYLVPAQAEPDLALLYVDPEIALEVIAPAARPDRLVARPSGQDAQSGDLLADEMGRHVIKALDVKKDGQRHLAYVDVETGNIRPRQERGSLTVYAAWTLVEVR